ncbi:hypothetical protein [Streptomyces antimycoticus]|uniref:hypothetical protein n=1 Tax=Streptomyces antimycoticus TaxID=68175 RepID=UPI000A3D4A53|nr:hypothetical protein [Streptomyces antimycoticus]
MITILLGVLLGSAVIWLLCLARTVGTRHAPRLAQPGPFRPVADGTRWTACHDMACGHMATRHLLQPDGTYRCSRWTSHRGAVHLTPTDGAQ